MKEVETMNLLQPVEDADELILKGFSLAKTARAPSEWLWSAVQSQSFKINIAYIV